MKKSSLMSLLLLSAVCAVPQLQAVPKEYEGIAETIPPKEIDWVKRASLHSKGNITVYVDDDGVPTEVYVIGVAQVPVSMAAVDAEEEALEDAEFNAKAAFAIWMHENFMVKNIRGEKRIVVRTGSSGNAGKVEETSERSVLSKSQAEQSASGMWRGMSTFADERQNGRQIVVWKWSVKEHQLARIVEMLTRDGDPDAVNRKLDMKVKSYPLRFR